MYGLHIVSQISLSLSLDIYRYIHGIRYREPVTGRDKKVISMLVNDTGPGGATG